MLKDNNLTDALVQLINAMPESEREKIAHLITKRKSRTVRKGKTLKQKAGVEKKNFDIQQVASLLSKIKKKKIFQKIENPLKWQKQLRNEWE